jgi:2'-5' RNA ligase
VGVFWAVLPTAEALAILDRHLRPELEGVVWEPAERLHVTVRYFGGIDDGLLGRLTALTEHLASSTPSPEVRLGPATERLGRDGTLVVPAAGVEAMARACDELLASEGLDEQLDGRDHPFYGHLTLARRRRRAPVVPEELLGLALEAAFHPPRLSLVVSSSGPEGRRYSFAAEAAFGS